MVPQSLKAKIFNCPGFVSAASGTTVSQDLLQVLGQSSCSLQAEKSSLERNRITVIAVLTFSNTLELRLSRRMAMWGVSSLEHQTLTVEDRDDALVFGVS